MWDGKTNSVSALTRILFRVATLAGVLIASSATASLAADTFALQTESISAGGAQPIGNSCSRLFASIGQPAPGFSESADHAISVESGFQAIAADGPRDTIFFSGFEGCIP